MKTLAGPRIQEAALGGVQEGQRVVEEVAVAAVVVPGEKVGVGSGETQEPVMGLVSGAWL